MVEQGRWSIYVHVRFGMKLPFVLLQWIFYLRSMSRTITQTLNYDPIDKFKSCSTYMNGSTKYIVDLLPTELVRSSLWVKVLGMRVHLLTCLWKLEANFWLKISECQSESIQLKRFGELEWFNTHWRLSKRTSKDFDSIMQSGTCSMVFLKTLSISSAS